MRHIRCHVLVRLFDNFPLPITKRSRMDTGTIYSLALLQKDSLERCFGPVLKLTFMMICLALFCPTGHSHSRLPSRLEQMLQWRSRFIEDFPFSSFHSIPTPPTAVESLRQNVADQRTHRAFVWKSLETSNCVGKE